MDTFLSITAIIISIIALSVSIKFGLRTDKLNKQYIKKNEEEFENERKANIIVKAEKTGNNWHLIIVNKGKATARNVDFDPDELNQENEIFLQKSPDDFPIPELFSGDYIRLNIVLGSMFKNYPKIKLKWDDDYAKGRSKEQTVNLVV